MDRRKWSVRLRLPAILFTLLLTLTWPLGHGEAALLQGDVFTNTAWLSLDGTRVGEVSTDVTIAFRTPSSLQLLRYATGNAAAELLPITRGEYSTSGSKVGPFAAQSLPLRADGTPFDLSGPIPLLPSELFLERDAVFVRITDRDQNLRPNEIESVLVTITSSAGDQEVLLLLETAANTGVFIGYIQSQAGSFQQGDGHLTIEKNGSITAHYRDRSDLSDVSASAGLFDPLGIVFNSLTGQPVDDVTLTIYRLDNGIRSLAEVYGDDGVSRYPATVVSGGAATDEGGTVYDFPPGGYRFPLMRPGTYLIETIPPSGFIAPSMVTTAELQLLPGAPFVIHDTGSRGMPFDLDPVPIMHIDIPIDPLAGLLWVVKSTGKASAGIGDFIPYRLTVQNTSSGGFSRQTVLHDRLPAGFRYQQGSSRIDGAASPDPEISADGRDLTYTLGDLLPGQSRSLSYVAAVGPRAKPGDAVNTAMARENGGAVSNIAEATVKVREELLRSRAWIFGQVTEGECGEVLEQRGIAGVRLFMEDGTFVMTDSEGRYHFEGVTAGTHVVQLDLDSLAPWYDIVLCEDSTRSAGNAFSQFVDLQGGSLWRTDFHIALKPRPQGEIKLRLESQAEELSGRFQLSVENGAIPLENVRLSVNLPPGAIYRSCSSTMGGNELADPKVAEQTLEFFLGALDENQQRQLSFQAELGGEETAELPVSAILTFDSPTTLGQQTPPAEVILRRDVQESRQSVSELVYQLHFSALGAELVEKDREHLAGMVERLRRIRNLHLTVVGHSDNLPIAPHMRYLFQDNLALSAARAQNVGVFLKGLLNLDDDRITLNSLGDTTPIADNGSEEGRALNRRVDFYIEGEEVQQSLILQALRRDSGYQSVPTEGLRPGETPLPVAAPAGVSEVEPASGILSPQDGALLPHETNAVQVTIDSRLKPVLLVDGKTISADRIGFTMVDRKTRKALYSYIGINFGAPGPRQVQIKGIDPFGNSRFEQTITVIRTGKITSMKLIDAGDNIADGKTPLRVRVELADQAGLPVQGAIRLELTSSSLRPHLPAEEKTVTGPDRKKSSSHVSVDAQGWVTFAPVSASGPHRATLRYGDLSLEVETYVKPHLRDWILVGLAEGTAGYSTLSGNMETPDAAEAEEGWYQDGRLAFYAKGRIKGEWLLTMAYDSDKAREENRLFGTIDPKAYYPLYGDATVQGYGAASSEKLYLRLERDQFYALFGDFTTDLSVTELARYSRSLTGIKAQWQGRHFDLNVFASDTGQNFVKNELLGDGTSGLYRLTQRNIVVNSEKIVIEVRDRFRSEVVVEKRELWRYVDYTIDYQEGTIFFKEPVMSQDAEFNPVWIVVDYETADAGGTSLVYGGRGALRFPDERIDLGATLVREEAGNGRLSGMDAKWELAPGTLLRAEAASSRGIEEGKTEEGEAYLAELLHLSDRLSGRFYFREADEGFGLGQQSASETGMRKYGGEGRWRFLPNYSLGAQYYQQHNLEKETDRELLESSVQYADKIYRASLGWRYVTDRLADGQSNRSTQGIIGGSWQATAKLNLHLKHEQTLAAGKNSKDFPTRTLVGGDYQLFKTVAFFAEQEWTHGDEKRTEGTRAGIKSAPWAGGELQSSVEQRISESSARTFANFGLKQSWQFTPKWSFAGTLDRSDTVRESGVPNGIDNVPAASGSTEDFTAISVGTSYKEVKWSWDNRLEYRTADSEDKWGTFSAIIGEVREGLALSARAQIFLTDATSGAKMTDGELSFGLAHRPRYSRWMVLDRLDYIFDENTGAAFDLITWRLVNNLHTNFKPNSRTQISFQYGAKYVRDNIDGDSYSSFTDVVGLETRYDFTADWDFGLHGNVLHSWNSGQLDYRSGASVGYNVMKNAWVSLGYNFLGFQDEDFSRADFTAQGPFMRMRIKVDQNSVREALQWF